MVIREATLDDLDAIFMLKSINQPPETVKSGEGVWWTVAESDGRIIACLGESDDRHKRWVTDWYGDGSNQAKVALLRLEQEFERRAKEDDSVHMVIGVSEPQDMPNLQAAVTRGWTVLGVLIGKAV
jgi:hypothetical protein